MPRTSMLTLGFIFSTTIVSLIQAADKRPGAFVVAPKEGAVVGLTCTLSGKTFFRGQPLALVRAVGGDGHWWVQRTIQRNDRGQLLGKLQFGNQLVEPGTRFEFVVVVVQTPLELEFFTKRETLAEMPANVPRSEIRSVVYGAPADEKAAADQPLAGAADAPGAPPAKGADAVVPANVEQAQTVAGERNVDQAKKAEPATRKAEPERGSKSGQKPGATPLPEAKGKPAKPELVILKPLSDASVHRFEEFVGRVATDGERPVVLVRPEGPEGQWWVQDQVVFGEGRYFKTRLHFGNDTTPEGTRFMVIVVSLPRDADEDAMRPGTALPELPRGLLRSKEVIVQLNASATPEGGK